jgi:lysozyme family protein
MNLDGMYMGADGYVWKIFAPRFWQVWRWVDWYFAAHKRQISTTINGKLLNLRTILVEDGMPPRTAPPDTVAIETALDPLTNRQ